MTETYRTRGHLAQSHGITGFQHTLFKIEIQNKNDILILERQIRQLLQCETLSECNFIKTTPYKQMMMSILLKLNNVISFDEECKIYFGSNTLLLFMHSDAKTVEIKKKDLDQIVTDILNVVTIEEEEEEEYQKLNNNNGKEGNVSLEDIVFDHRLNDQRKRKYPRKNQEESFVAKFIHNRFSSSASKAPLLPL